MYEIELTQTPSTVRCRDITLGKQVLLSLCGKASNTTLKLLGLTRTDVFVPGCRFLTKELRMSTAPSTHSQQDRLVAQELDELAHIKLQGIRFC